ncbi:MAG TPA: tetratricopeptide repeat protein [Saprospiraceae bacterium]|nr:tetratricopeptide repeat protein [Saprospiraceae bacterium]
MNLLYKFIFLSTILFFTIIKISGQQINIPDSAKEESDAESIIIDAKKNVFIGKYDVAINLLEKLIQKDRTNNTAIFELAKVYQEKNDWPNVQRYMDQALKNDPKNFYFLEYYTKELSRHPFDLEREKYFTSLINHNRSTLQHYDQYIDYLISNKKFANAKPVMDQLIVKFGESEKVLQRSYEICNLSNCKEKESIIKKLIAKDNSNIGYLKLLAQNYVEKNNQKAAMEVYGQVLMLNPNDTEANLAVLKTTDKKQNAEAAYLRTIIPLIKNPNIHIDEKIKELMPYLRELVEKRDPAYLSELSDIGQNLTLTHPNEAKAQAFYGDVLYAGNNYKAAIQQYQKTLKLNDKNFSVWENLMYSLQIVGEYEELVNVSSKAVDLFPNKVESYIVLANALVLTDKLNDAKEIIEEAAMVSGGNPKFLKDIVAIQNITKDIKSLSELQKKYGDQIESESMDPLVLEMLGDAAMKEGNSSLAREYYRKALERGHKNLIEKLFMRGIKLN